MSLASTTADLHLTVTNVYAPSDHSLTDNFVSEMTALLLSISDLWLILGDFNLNRHPREKNNNNFNPNLAASFNSMIRSMSLFELPLLDRLYTRTYRLGPLTLARLDRAFFNIDSPLPHLRPRPLLVTATASIPSSRLFHFENAWLLDPSILPTTLPAWADPPLRDLKSSTGLPLY